MSCSFSKIKKTDKNLRLSEQAKEKDGETQINKIRDESQSIHSKYLKMKKPEEMDEFQITYEVLKLNQKDIKK